MANEVMDTGRSFERWASGAVGAKGLPVIVLTDGGLRKGSWKAAAGWVAVAVVDGLPCWLGEGGVEVPFNPWLSSFVVETIGIDEAMAKLKPLFQQDPDADNLRANRVAFTWAREEEVVRRLRGG